MEDVTDENTSVLLLPSPTSPSSAPPSTTPLPSTTLSPIPSPPFINSPPPTQFTTSFSSVDASFPILPLAALVAIVIALFVIFVAGLLLLRKLLKNKGIVWSRWLPEFSICTHDEGIRSCKERCLLVAEAMDCSIPSCQVWLDNTCPSKQQCSVMCSKIWSCYCCLFLSGECQDVQFCPSCSAIECPDCSCCGDCCHCTMKTPECSQVTCLCFECGRPPTNNL